MKHTWFRKSADDEAGVFQFVIEHATLLIAGAIALFAVTSLSTLIEGLGEIGGLYYK